MAHTAGYVPAPPLRLPFSGSEVLSVECSRAGAELPPIAPSPDLIARHASSMGALKARAIAGVQMGRLFAAYAEYGPLTDLEAEDRTGIQRSSVIPRRRALMKQGLVVAIGSKKERTGVTNTTWGLAKS